MLGVCTRPARAATLINIILKANPEKNYGWHRNNIVPCLDLCESLFSTKDNANGRTEENLDHPSEARLARIAEAVDGDRQRNRERRKRAASTESSTSKRSKGSKGSRTTDIERIVEAMKEPVRLENVVFQKAMEKWYEDAMIFWAREYSGKIHLAIEREIKRSWRKDPAKALEFVTGDKKFRHILLLDWGLKLGIISEATYRHKIGLPHNHVLPTANGGNKEEAEAASVNGGNGEAAGADAGD